MIGDYSSSHSFFTGPECTSLAEVVAPVRLAPADGSVVNTLFAALKYTPGIPGCIPDGYLLHLHEMADFSDPNLLTENLFPATTVLTDPLTNCTTYYWSVTALQGGGYGPESDHGSFFVDVDGTCLPPGVPGTAKSSNFCREGTYEVFKADWTVVEGDRILAIARNPLSTYLKITILDQKTKKPFEPEIRCWTYMKAYETGWPELPAVQTYRFEDLPVENPPVPPDPTPTPVPPTCNEKLSLEDCKAAGGTFTDKKYCACP